MQKPADTVDKEFLIDDHDGGGEQKLEESHGHGVILDEGRKRPAPHDTTHGKIHERKHEDHRCDQSLQKGRGLLICERVGRGCALRGLSAVTFLEGRAVACLLDGGDDYIGGDLTFNPHGVGQEADRAGGDAVQRRYGFFHTGLARGAGHSCDIVLFHMDTSFLVVR